MLRVVETVVITIVWAVWGAPGAVFFIHLIRGPKKKKEPSYLFLFVLYVFTMISRPSASRPRLVWPPEKSKQIH